MTKSSKPQKPKQQIFDAPKNDNIGISLWTDETLQAITKNSGKLTRGNEYQVHYWALNIRVKAQDESILDISIPTLFFNYEQQVSGAHIDFELDDVDNVSNALEPLHNAEVNRILPIIETHFRGMAGQAGITVEYTSTNLNSLHRHPGGRRQSFSGTDYNKDAKAETGIVFPLSEGVQKANFASIIAHDSGKTYLAHTEYRLANGKIDADKGEITYSKGRCASFVKSPKHTVSDIERMFGYVDRDLSYSVTDGLDPSTMVEFITNWWNNFEYQPNMQFIKEQNVSEKKWKSNAKTNYQQKTVTPAKFGKQTQMEYDDTVSGLPYPIEAIIKFAVEQLNFNLPHPSVFEQLAQDELNNLYNAMEVHYYGIGEEIEGIDDPDMLEMYGITLEDVDLADTIELFNNVIDEITDAMSEIDDVDSDPAISSMRVDLIQLGAREDAILAASESQIRQWYKEIFGDI